MKRSIYFIYNPLDHKVYGGIEKMEIRKIKNKEGEQLVSKEGKPFTHNYLETGDVFKPLHNEAFEKVRKITKDGKEITIKEFSLEAEVYKDNIGRVYLRLTNNQALQLKKDVKEALDKEDMANLPKNNTYEAYSYMNNNITPPVECVGIKQRKYEGDKE